MADCAIIFDVDGVLLDLTRAEEELFFKPFASRCDASKLSRDWNAYAIRNDEEIVAELVRRHGLAEAEKYAIKTEYLSLLQNQLASDTVSSPIISGANELLIEFSGRASLGIATANFLEAAKLRLAKASLWHHVSNHAFGADGGGHKHEILGRALATIATPKSRIIYIGDNLNDVEAGLRHRVNFIGFSLNAQRRETLRNAGAANVSSNHHETKLIIRSILFA
jgi:phosphoglycolate phosphatase-like HAD superfamily hydrolase